MRQVALILVAAAVLAVPQAAAKLGVPSQLLAFVGSGRDVSVVKVDALTLKPISRAARLGLSNPTFVARVAGGGRAAIADGTASLRFLDLQSMRWAGRVAYPGAPTAAVWNYADKLVTLNQSSTAEMIVVDPTKRRLGATRNLGGPLVASAVARDHIVAVIAPLEGIGASKLVVIDDRGRIRTTPLPQIRAGSETHDNNRTQTFAWPALAVDPLAAEAVVVAADGTIVDVNVYTLATTTHATRSPAAARKEANGSLRVARWLGAGTIAVTGDDWSWDGTTQRVTPAGLTLIDIREWSVRQVDRETRGATATFDNAVLAYGSNGLAAYRTDGTLRFHVLQGTPVGTPLVAAIYAYLPGANPATRFTIVNASTGAIVKTVDTAEPTLLTASWSY